MALTGLYYDGQSAAMHRVALVLHAEALSLVEDGRELARWPFDTLRLLSRDRGELRVTSDLAESARLVVTEPEAIAALRAAVPRLFKTSNAFLATLRIGLVGVVASATLGVAVFYGLPPLAERLVPFISPEVEAQIGDNARIGLTEIWPACEGTENAEKANEVLLGLAQRLTAKSPLSAPVRVEIVEMPIENAFALPGGHILLTQELVERMEHPDELAGVLAHEIGHVAERHGMIGVVQQMDLSALTSLLIGGGSNSGELFVNAGATITSFSYTRRLEERADQRAIQYLAAANIDPAGFARFFERLDAEGDEEASKSDKSSALSRFNLKLPRFLSTHPPSPERAALARKAAAGSTVAVLTDPQWATIKAACDVPAAPETPPNAQGSAPANTPPQSTQSPKAGR